MPINQPQTQSPLFSLSRVALAPGRLVDVSVKIGPKVTAVIGPSGAGKTSLLNVLAGFEAPVAGSLQRPASVFWAPQDGGLWPGLSVGDHLSAMTRDAVAIAGMLDAFELTACVKQAPETLSRGQQARLSVARALLSDASALVMDEPLAHVDAGRRPQFWQVIRDSIATRGQSLIFATHEPESVLGEATDVLCITSGSVVFHGAVADLYWRPQSPGHAAFLGPANWISDDDKSIWFPDAAGDIPRCLRPEQLRIDDAPPSSASPITVHSARFRGSHEELVLRHHLSDRAATFWHRPGAPTLTAGAAVKLSVR